MKESTRENIIALHSSINEFWSNEKYCDVTIRIGEKSFKCHRLILGSASKYFDAMFQGNFKESKSEDIELKEIEATTFEEVVQFIYTGDVLVSESNVLNLIRTSEFYDLPNLKTLCCQFIEEKIELGGLIKDALEIFSFSYGTTCSNDKDKLVVSVSAYIREHLHYFVKTPSFLNIQFKELEKILMQSAPSINENEVVHAIIHWVDHSNHSKDVNDENFNVLLEKINYENVSPEYMKLIVKRCVQKSRPIVSKESENYKSKEKDDDVSTVESSIDSEVGKICLVDSMMTQSLYVYVKTPKNVTNVFTLQKQTLGFDWVFLCKANDYSDVMRNVSLGDHLYCLNRFKSQELSSSVQTLSVSSSVLMFDKSYLKAPPLVVNRFDMCGMNNHLYMYNRDIFSSVVRGVESSNFDDEVISRGVYIYNCETDRWMSLPPLLAKLANACMTCDHERGLIYLIGGSNQAQSTLQGYVQAYDPRSTAWMAISRTRNLYENGACCFSNHFKNIMVYGGTASPRKHPEIYVRVAGKWMTLAAKMNEVENCHRLISYGKNVWAFGQNVSESSVEVLLTDKSIESWSSISSLSAAVGKNQSVQATESSVYTLADCVTFQPYGL